MNNTSLKCVILAGGKGTRLRARVTDVPKPMAPIGDKPFLYLLMNYFVDQGITDFVLSVGYMRDVIMNYFSVSPWPGVSIAFVEEDEPLGTGGAICLAADRHPASHYLIMNGDSICQFGYTDFIDALQRSGCQNGMVASRQDDCSRYGKVTIEPGSQRVIALEEKRPEAGAGLINAGIYLLSQAFVRQFASRGAFSFEQEAFAPLVDAGLYAHTDTQAFIDIGIPEDYDFLCINRLSFFGR